VERYSINNRRCNFHRSLHHGICQPASVRAATDVFPVEPAPPELPARQVDGLLLSSHRAGGLPSALAAIGEMVVDDLGLILSDLPPQRLQAARSETVGRWRNAPGRSYAAGTRL